MKAAALLSSLLRSSPVRQATCGGAAQSLASMVACGDRRASTCATGAAAGGSDSGWWAGPMASLAAALVWAGDVSEASAAEEQSGRSSAGASSIPVDPAAAHPLDMDPVTNEHTANMTLARAAALDLYQAGKYRQAEAKFIEALEQAALGFDAKDPHLASTRNNLAEFYRNTGQYDKAEKLYKEALELLESIYGEKHWLYVSAMHNLALMYDAQGELAKARSTMERVLALRLQMFGPRHFLYADTMFALGHILLKQGKQDKQGLGMMKDAVAILEDAESVQVQVVLFWLDELAAEYKKRGRTQDAINCIRKGLFHLGNDKGEQATQASQLNDQLVEALLESKQPAAAREAMQSCVSARTAMFGKELVVAQSLVKLANIEAQIGKADSLASALQNVQNAVNLAQELLDEYNKSGSLFGGQAPDRRMKRLKAAHILGTSLKLLAALQQQKPQGNAEGARVALQRAVEVLQSSTHSAQQVMQSAGRPGSKVDVDEVAAVYVESQLLLLDLLEELVKVLSGVAGQEERIKDLQQKADQIAQALL